MKDSLTATGATIPVIDIAPLFQQGTSAARHAVDNAIGAACRSIGFFVVTGQPDEARLNAASAHRLLSFFDLPAELKRPLARRNYVPENRNIYRGYFWPKNGEAAYKEGIDLGPELNPADPRLQADNPGSHPLLEANNWPPETALPDWRAAVLDYFAAMESVGFALLHAIARHLGLTESYFDTAFTDGNSTLRLLRYPVRTPESYAGLTEQDAYRDHQGRRHAVMTREHCDSGCLTLLHQDSAGGLQAKRRDGVWLDVPFVPGGIVVNLGDMMQFWTNNLFVATQHRVLGFGEERFSIPFFFEPRLDARIAPPATLCPDGTVPPPVLYGDHLIEKSLGFAEFRDFLPAPKRAQA